MNERAEPQTAKGPSKTEPGAQPGAPGRKTSVKETAEDEREPLFADDAAWESAGDDDGGEDSGGGDSGGDTGEASGTIHVCHAGCAHAQFGRMMDAQTSQGFGRIAPGAIEEAVARWKSGQPTPDPEGGATPSGPPDMTTPGGGNRQVARAGTVSSGKPAGFPSEYGKATWSYDDFKYPELKVNASQQPDKSWQAKIDATTSADNSSASAVATPAGVYDLAQTESIKADGKTVVMKVRYVVSDANAAQIKAAEQEHLDDLTQAYKITLQAAEKAVNDKAKTTFSDKTKAKATAKAKKAVADALPKKLGGDKTAWARMLKKCASLTNSFRDNNAPKRHTFDALADGKDIDLDKKRITYRVQPNDKLGTPSATVIKL